MNKLIVNVETGVEEYVPLTAEEVADAEARAAEPAPEPVDRLAALEAEVRGMKERAAAEAGKSSPTAKGVAEAVTGPTP